jgi:hypothetical protein
MLRAGFAMKLLPGNVDEYKRRHDEIWPELVEELEKAGVRDYVIYLDPESPDPLRQSEADRAQSCRVSAGDRRGEKMVGLHGRPDGDQRG